MRCSGTTGCLCGCCAGTGVQTPQSIANAAGQSSVLYRSGTWANFKQSLLARLSSSDYPALAKLRTRDDDDFTIAFLDATAVVLDILTFYQERLANESYLGTATQLRSLTELARLIGYQPSPGVAASVYVAFTLKAAPGQPIDPSTPAITIPAGTQVQSIPAQGQKPQVFETSADIAAKADWNALPVEAGQPWVPPGANYLYLQGTTTQLQVGDSLLILDADRENWAPFAEWQARENVAEASRSVWRERVAPAGSIAGGRPAPRPPRCEEPSAVPSEQWDVVVINEVQVDKLRNLTYVAWAQKLIHASGDGTSGDPSGWAAAKVFALRQKAGLFGNNAADPNVFVNNNVSPAAPSFPSLISTTGGDGHWAWKNFQIPSTDQIDLDSTYPKIVAGSWFALTSAAVPNISGQVAQLYKVQQATTVSLAKFALTGKVTELSPDYADTVVASTFQLQATQVWAQSEELAIAYQPLDYPLYGGFLDLQALRPDLVGARVVAISGNRQKLAVADGVTTLSFVPDDQSGAMPLKPGDLLTLTAPSPLPLNSDSSVPDWNSVTDNLSLYVEDANGRPGTVIATLNDFTLAPAASNDPEVSEYALVKSVAAVSAPYPHTQILLQSNLLNCYDRDSATVNANVGLATNGQSVSEFLGSGSASTPNQEFTLKQSPLTYVQAPTPTGRQSTLEVRVNGASWTEVPSLYGQGPSQQVFSVRNQSDGTADAIFGDGVEGTTLPTGQNNIQADYRVGLGSAGNVATGALSMLIDRPLGVSGVTNPQSATGGEDPESVDDVRQNAPQSVLTIGRAVSITDYQSYAATFAGIAKSHAIWVPGGPARGVLLTVAGANGAPLPPGNPTLANLLASLQNFGNPLVPITAMSFLETLFGLSADLAYDPAYDRASVQAAVLQALKSTYSFAKRGFGQGVSGDEVSAVIQGVAGVLAVNVTSLRAGLTSAAGDLAGVGGFSLSAFNSWLAQQVTGLPRPGSGSPSRIYPYVPVVAAQSAPYPAEILVLDPNPNNVTLGVMS